MLKSKLGKNALMALATIGLLAPVPALADRGDRGYRDRGYSDDYRYRDGRSYRSDYRGDRVTRNTRVWRGNDGRYYCRKDNGTTGLLIGGAVGGLAGHEIAGRGDKTLGAILGAAGGALLGRAIDKGDSRCR